MNYSELTLSNETSFINGTVMLFENESFSHDFSVQKDGFYTLTIDYKHYDWDHCIFLDVASNGNTLRYKPSLPCDRSSIHTTIKLFKGINTITLSHIARHELFINSLSVSKNVITPKYKITPTNDCFYINSPCKKHSVIFNYGDPLISVTADNIEISFECSPTKNALDEGACNGHDTFKCDVVLDIQKADLTEGTHILKFLFESGKVITQTLKVFDKYEKAPFKIISFDVGNAGSSLICLPNGKHLLVDSGYEKPCKKTVIPYLQRNGITVDYYLLTHFHSDHYGALEEILEMYNIPKPSGRTADEYITASPTERYAFLSNYRYLDSSMICTYDEIDKIWDLGGVTMQALCSRFDEQGNAYGIGFNSNIPFNEHNYENATSVSFIMHYGNFGYYHGADNYAYIQEKNLNDFKKLGKENLLKCNYFYGNHHFHVDVNYKFIQFVNPTTVYVPANCSVYSRSAYTYDYKDNVENLDFPEKRLSNTLITEEIGTAVFEVYDNETTLATYISGDDII